MAFLYPHRWSPPRLHFLGLYTLARPQGHMQLGQTCIQQVMGNNRTLLWPSRSLYKGVKAVNKLGWDDFFYKGVQMNSLTLQLLGSEVSFMQHSTLEVSPNQKKKYWLLLIASPNQIPELHEYFVIDRHVSYPCQCVFKRVTGFQIWLLSSLPSSQTNPSWPTFSDNLLSEVNYNNGWRKAGGKTWGTFSFWNSK